MAAALRRGSLVGVPVQQHMRHTKKCMSSIVHLMHRWEKAQLGGRRSASRQPRGRATGRTAGLGAAGWPQHRAGRASELDILQL